MGSLGAVLACLSVGCHPGHSGSQAAGAVDCTAVVGDGGVDDAPYLSFVSGTFSGGLDGEVCAKGARGYLERASGSVSVPSQLALIVYNNVNADTATQMQFRDPSDATGGELSVLIGGFASATPGTYTNAETCGSVVLTAELATNVDCGDSSGVNACPPGCALQGPILGPSCQPIVSSISYQAQTASDCVSGGKTPLGSWSVTLTSVTLLDPPDGSFGTGYYVVHGTLNATLVGEDTDAGASAATTELRLSF